MMVVAHEPERPSWECRACGRPWPCDPAREDLATMAGRTPLAVYMALQLYDAALDLSTAPPDELYERFIGWTRSATR